MIDIIHDSISSPFACAYDNLLGGFMLNITFCTQLSAKKTDFASAYAKGESAAIAKMDEVVQQFSALLAQNKG